VEDFQLEKLWQRDSPALSLCIPDSRNQLKKEPADNLRRLAQSWRGVLKTWKLSIRQHETKSVSNISQDNLFHQRRAAPLRKWVVNPSCGVRERRTTLHNISLMHLRHLSGIYFYSASTERPYNFQSHGKLHKCANYHNTLKNGFGICRT